MGRIRKHLGRLIARAPAIVVVSANILPDHKAVLEGDHEVALTTRESLAMRVNDVTLHLRPRGFFQTNTAVAAALYRSARELVDDAAPATVWDLYCGVGGFALHALGLPPGGRHVTGVEVSADAVAGAERSAREAGLSSSVSFLAGDAAVFARRERPPDLVIVNPPRRGIGADLASWLEDSGVRAVIYSSCHIDSLAADLARMPSMGVETVQVFDMFPNTTHHETHLPLASSAGAATLTRRTVSASTSYRLAAAPPARKNRRRSAPVTSAWSPPTVATPNGERRRSSTPHR